MARGLTWQGLERHHGEVESDIFVMERRREPSHPLQKYAETNRSIAESPAATQIAILMKIVDYIKHRISKPGASKAFELLVILVYFCCLI